MDASAEALAAALPRTRTVPGDAPALPEAPGEVGLVPEHGLLPVRERARQAGSVVLAPLDHTAALRYSWLPTAAAAADPARAAALDRLAAALTGPAADGPLAQAGLRRPGGGPPPGVEGLPAAKAPLFDVLGPHHVDHVLASWYAADRRSDLLVAVDVSGSMRARAPGSDRAVIEVVRDGVGDAGLAAARRLAAHPVAVRHPAGRHPRPRGGAARHDPGRRGPGRGVARRRAARPAATRAPACTTPSWPRTRRPGTQRGRTCPATSSSSPTGATRPTSPR